MGLVELVVLMVMWLDLVFDGELMDNMLNLMLICVFELLVDVGIVMVNLVEGFVGVWYFLVLIVLFVVVVVFLFIYIRFVL